MEVIGLPGFNEEVTRVAPSVHKGTGSLAPRVNQTENEEPHPQVVVALGFLMTNCAPCKSSL
jgi:hypothetical protein